MAIYLGNLTPQEMATRLHITLTKEDEVFFEEHRQEVCDKIGEWEYHCFDMPFEIHAGSLDMATEIFVRLKKYEQDIKGNLQICVDERRRDKQDGNE